MAKITVSVPAATGEGGTPPLSKAQKAFNTLVARIEKKRVALADWQAFDPEFQRKLNDEVLPAQEAFRDARMRMVRRLDEAHSAKGMTKTERETMGQVITTLVGDLLGERTEPELIEIYQRYNPTPEETSDEETAFYEEAGNQMIRDEILERYGVEIDADIDISDVDAVMNHVYEKMDRGEDQERAREEARKDYHANRRKTPKSGAAEERARVEKEEVTVSLREVYRKLVSALHPDREPDPVERARKASLMQRVNQAYAARKLLDLLEIQLELEHIDQAALDNVSEERLKRWTKILKDQLRDLEIELRIVEEGFENRSGLYDVANLTPKVIKRAMNEDLKLVREGRLGFERDMRVFDDPKELKAWLKDMKRALVDMRRYDQGY